ncbi:hypothetical protein ONZ51_g8076 [Trametes cubensis]|uniref:Uncharacterized protein n=1 Tax=Trametes cubensis TaxID=1111947 RepID=A0AAD7X8H3_9APHY|nr:hypothetical protein ONZ51_g8076 [Trametes cubensis]
MAARADGASDAVQRVWAGLCQTGAPSPVDPPSASAADVSCSSLVSLFVSPRSALFTLHSAPVRHTDWDPHRSDWHPLSPLRRLHTPRVVSDGSGACIKKRTRDGTGSRGRNGAGGGSGAAGKAGNGGGGPGGQNSIPGADDPGAGSSGGDGASDDDDSYGSQQDRRSELGYRD